MNRKRGYLYILLAAMIYSTTEVALKGLGGVFAPMQITVERVLIGALFLLPFALRSLRRNRLPRLCSRRKRRPGRSRRHKNAEKTPKIAVRFDRKRAAFFRRFS